MNLRGSIYLPLRSLILLSLLISTGNWESSALAEDIQPTAPAEVKISFRSAETGVHLHLVAQGMNQPFDLVAPPDQSGRLFILDKSGLVYILAREGGLLDAPYLDLNEKLAGPDGEHKGGELYGLAFHPNFEKNGRVFVLYSFPYPGEGRREWGKSLRLAEFGPSMIYLNRADASDERVIYETELPLAGIEAVTLDTISSTESLVLTILESGQAPKTSRTCFSLSTIDMPEISCPGEEPSQIMQVDYSPLRQGLSLTNRASEPFQIVSGKVYEGQTLPSYKGRFIFASRERVNGREINRLYAANLPIQANGKWQVEELLFPQDEKGLIGTKLMGIGQDHAGEIYLLAASNPGEGQVGRVYKLLPLIDSQPSLIEDPKDYMPLAFRYGRMVRRAKVYKTLDDVRSNQPFGTHGGGNYWVSERGSASVDGRLYYRVSWAWGQEAWAAAADIAFDAPLSHLKGINLSQFTGRPVGMSYQVTNVRSQPDMLQDETIIGKLNPYELVTIESRQYINGEEWYRIGRDQWVLGQMLRVFALSPRPVDIGADEKWVEINLTEQTLIAYEGDRAVFATLVSSGRSGLETQPGLFRVWAKFREAPMRWEEARLPYSLANVPWIMYFNNAQGLHAAYWHDLFGTVRSSGCVNLSPRDAHWLFHWAGPHQEPEQRLLYPTEEDPGLWVWVHSTQPKFDDLIHTYLVNRIVDPAKDKQLD